MMFVDYKLIDNEENKGKDSRIIEKAKFFKTSPTAVAEKHLDKFLKHEGVLIEKVEDTPVVSTPVKEETEEEVKVDTEEVEIEVEEKDITTESLTLPENPKKSDLVTYLVSTTGKDEEALNKLKKSELLDLLK